MRPTLRAARSIFLAFGLGISSWAPMVPFAKDRLEFDDAQLGLMLLLAGVGSLGTMPLAGWLIHRYGTRVVALLSAFVVTLLLPLLALGDTPFLLSSTLFLFGAATGILNVSINAQAVAIETKSRSHVMSGLHCYFSAGGLLGALIVSTLLECGLPLPLCASCISVLMLILVTTQGKHLLPHEKEMGGTKKSNQRVFAFPGFNVLFLGVLCFMAFMSERSMLDWSAEFLRSSLNYTTVSGGIGYALFSIGMVLGRLFGDRLIERFNLFRIFQGGSFLAACGFALVISGLFPYAELIGFGFIGFGCSNIVPILFSATGRLTSISPSVALSAVTTIAYVGALFGPALIGFIAEATTLSVAFAFLALSLIGVGVSGRAIIPVPVKEPIHAP